MAEITLQEYQTKLEELLQQNRTDEVIQHSRHVLKHFPKNVAVYRLLGMALNASTRYDEAGDVFRRVLSVYPDDLEAHRGLSRVAQMRQNGEAAIWHIERAVEQAPGNKALLETLRELYSQFRGIEQDRFQLTARAVAAQQVRVGLNAKAIDTLQRALAHSPERVDLRVLLAQVLWEDARHVQAAETALEVLKTQPDCLQANRIMTQLWLMEQRPSDAQRYLSRIEAVDPYFAFELAQGGPPPYNAFRISEFDYQREASRQLTTENPDWLESLEQVPSATTADDEDEIGASLDDDWLGTLSDEADEEDQSDWMQELDNVQSAAAEPTRKVSTEQFRITDESLAELFGDDDDDLPTEEPSKHSELRNTGLTGLLSTLGDKSDGSTGLTGLLNALDEEPEEEESSEDDWMQAVNKPTAPLRDPSQTTSSLAGSLPATSDLPDLSDLTDDDSLLEIEDDGLDWLNDEPVIASEPIDADDPLAWMKQSGIEFLEGEEESGAVFDPASVLADDLEDYTPLTEPTENDPLAWMRGTGIEMVEEEEEENLDWMTEAHPLSTDELPGDSSDPLGWMKQSGVEMIDDDEESPPPPPTPEPKTPTDSLDWLADDDQLDELLDLEIMAEQGTDTLTATGSLSEAQDRQEVMGDNNNIPDWLTSDDDDEDAELDWMNEPETAAPIDVDALFGGTNAEADALDWLSGAGMDDDTDEEDDAVPSWLSGASSTPEPAASMFDDADEDAVPDWLTGAGIADDTDEPAAAVFDDADEEDEAVPSWLSGASSTPEPAASMFDDADEDEDAVPDWLTGAGIADDTDEPAAASIFDDADEEDDAVPSWLSGTSSTPEPAAAMFDDADEEDEAVPSWLSGTTSTDDSASEAEEDAVPDWLTGVGVADDTDEPAAASMFDDADEEEDAVPSWLSGTSSTEEPAAAMFDDADEEDEAVPSWLSGTSSTEEPAAAMFDDADEEDDAVPSWLSGTSSTEEPAAAMFDDADEDEDAVPDWLTGVGVAGNTQTPTAADTADDFDFDTEAADDEEAVPDWLSGVGIAEDDDEMLTPATPAKSASDDFSWGNTTDENVPNWMAEDEDEFDLDDEDEAVPSWLSSIGTDLPDEDDEEEPAAQSFTLPEFGDDDQDEVIDAFDWMSDELDVEPTELANLDDVFLDEEAEAAASIDELDALPAMNAPDWLNAMVPGLDLDYDSEELSAAGVASESRAPRADYGWLTEIVDEELRPPVTMPEAGGQKPAAAATPKRRIGFTFSRPPAWLRKLRGEPAVQEATHDDILGDDDLPPWLDFDDDDQ